MTLQLQFHKNIFHKNPILNSIRVVELRGFYSHDLPYNFIVKLVNILSLENF